MRIIAGTHKGRRLTPPKDATARPTADRAREALFSILTSREAIFEGCRVLDCFAGTGALGLEALSRGAGHATFMELHPGTLAVLKANIYDLALTALCTALKTDAAKPPKAAQRCDLIFLDPPYHKNLIVPCLEALRLQGWIARNATLIVESAATESIEFPPGFETLDERRYGAAKISILGQKQ